MTASSPTTAGLRLFGVFLVFATTMACLAGFLLLKPGTVLDRVWALNPRAHQQLAPLGPWMGIAFLLLAVVGAYTTRLWFQRRILGWRLAVFAIAIQALGDTINFARGEVVPGLVGLFIAFGLLVLLLSRRVKSAFH
jgi:hypothetical protein